MSLLVLRRFLFFDGRNKESNREKKIRNVVLFPDSFTFESTIGAIPLLL